MKSTIALVWLFFCAFLVSAQTTCSASQPCAQGCCSKFGSCGFGADFCSAANCVGTCNAKSECDPGWGAQWSQSSKCPLNVCCSKYGYCGTTPEFCGSAVVQSPSCSAAGNSSSKRTIGYYEGWASTRGCNKMIPEQIPVGAYTHINFAFAFIDPTTFAVAPMSADQVPLYSRTTALKRMQPGLQVWIAIGGWSMNDPDQSTRTAFSNLVASPTAQQAFIKSLISFMATYGFDGVDLDWEYPVAPERAGTAADFANYVTFLANLKAALSSTAHGYGLSVTLPASYWYLRNFDIVRIAPLVDWMNMMTYDLHGTWDSSNKWIGSIVGAHTNLTEIDLSMQLLWRNNIDPAKVNLGLGFYGRSFKLANPACTAPGCAFTSGADPGPCTNTAGVLSFTEIKDIIVAGGATVTTDTAAAVQIVTYGNGQWVSYDNVDTLRMKVSYANSKCLGGTFVWAVSLDDNNGTVAAAFAESTNQLAIARKTTYNPTKDSVAKGCAVTQCQPIGSLTCPAGNSIVQLENSRGGVSNVYLPGCPNGQARVYCCPSNDQPVCQWRGVAPYCNQQGCNKQSVAIGQDASGCNLGTAKTLCCQKTQDQVALGVCGWQTGCSIYSLCDDGTKPAYSSELRPGANVCLVGKYHYCCPDPPPINRCKKVNSGSIFFCKGSCPAGQVEIFRDNNLCFGGSSAPVCCDAVVAPNDPLVSAFTIQLQNFLSNPTCSASEISPPVAPSYPGGDLFRRTANDENSNGAIDTRRDALLRRGITSAGGEDFIGTLILVMLGAGLYNADLRATWDSLAGSKYGFRASDFSAYLSNTPEYGPDFMARDALCHLADASNFLANYNEAQTLCTEDSPIARRTLETVDSDLDLELSPSQNDTSLYDLVKRVFSQGDTGPITTGALMQAYIDGNLPLLYVRQLRYTGYNNRLELNLEVAFDIRGLPALQQTPQDIFAVFHFHIPTIAADGRPQVQFFHAFHGQRVVRSRGSWRVDGFANTNARTSILNCPYIPGRGRRRWTPGNNPPQSAQRFHTTQIANFGRALRNNGILVPAVVNPDIAFGADFGRWDATTGTWTFAGRAESVNYGANGPANNATDMSPTGPAGPWPT